MKRVRQPLTRLAIVLAGICTAACAQAAGAWIQVKGGSWEPNAVTLSIAKSKLRHALELHIGHKVSSTQWHRYSFQYKGLLAPQGQRLIHLNAFCADVFAADEKGVQSKFDLTTAWVHGFGGLCFFSGTYNVADSSIADLEVNAPQ